MTDNGLLRARLGALLDGAWWSVGVAAVLFGFALLAAILVLQSPEGLLWTGQHAIGTEQNGLIVFRYQGRDYSASAVGSGSAKAASVYFDPGDPTNAMAENLPERAFTGALVGVPLLAGVAVLTIGLTRKQRWARGQRRLAGPQFGRGLDQDFVTRQLKEQRGGRPGDP
jgi:hypothetical protein